MKCLIWYCKELFVGNITYTDKLSKPIDKNIENINETNVLMPLVTIEKENDYNYFDDFLIDLKELKLHFNTKKIILSPFVHLSNSQIPFKNAYRIICDLESYLKTNDFEVKRAHFGSAKDLKFFSPADPKQVVFRSYPKPEFLK